MSSTCGPEVVRVRTTLLLRECIPWLGFSSCNCSCRRHQQGQTLLSLGKLIKTSRNQVLLLHIVSIIKIDIFSFKTSHSMLLSFHLITNILETSTPMCCWMISGPSMEFGALSPHFRSCKSATSLSSALHG